MWWEKYSHKVGGGRKLKEIKSGVADTWNMHGQIKWKVHELSGSKLLMKWSHIKRMICRLVESKGRSRLIGGMRFHSLTTLLK